MTAQTALPICSISKHLLCLVIASLSKRPTEEMKARAKQKGGKVDVWAWLDDELRALLPQLFRDDVEGGHGRDGRQLTVPDLFNMQSGIRDYWAMTVLFGARAEDPFSLLRDAPRTLGRTKSFHFPPGTEFSYSNVNFHILGRIVEEVAGHSLGQLLAERVFIPAGMKTAALSPNCASLPLPIVGYEGSEKSGYVPAINGIEWQGDAGVTASLNDMVAYEKYMHASWNDEESDYRAIASSAKFNNGSFASYSHGLWHTGAGGHEVLSHTGGLRGFRLQRLHVPEKQLSVVTMLNHETDPSATGKLMLKPLLGMPMEEKRSSVTDPALEWEGDFFCEDQQRVISVVLPSEKGEEGMVGINYAGGAKPEKLKLLDQQSAESTEMKASIEDGKLHLVRAADGVDVRCRRIATPSSPDVPCATDYAGEFYCDEAESTFTCYHACPLQDYPIGGVKGQKLMYGCFEGFLGRGPMHLMRYVGEDIWVLTCPRSMDAPAPGEWTVVFRRDLGSRVSSATVSCWLARHNEFVRKWREPAI